MENIYVSLDEAREELKKRWENKELKRKIEDELGDNFMPHFSDSPRAVLTKQVCVADNGFIFFNYCAKYINANPLSLEFLGDTFVHFNEEKKGLGRPRVALEDGSKAIADMIVVKDNENKKLSDCTLITGENMLDFHRKLMEVSGYGLEIHDNTSWYKKHGNAADYYYFLLLHFVAHGILFDVFQTSEDESENSFTNKVVLPAIQKIENKFGIKPLIFRQYPEDQTDEEDFYWWCYPPTVNKFIEGYAKENKINFKQV
jgi:hypothetical protein